MIVVDVNVIAYFWISQESDRTEEAIQARRLDAEWLAPNLWRSEFRSILRKYLRSSLLSLDEAIAIAESAERDMEGRSFDVPTHEILTLAAEKDASSYDCEYVALARSLGTMLVSGERRLAKQFPDAVVLLQDFAAG